MRLLHASGLENFIGKAVEIDIGGFVVLQIRRIHTDERAGKASVEVIGEDSGINVIVNFGKVFTVKGVGKTSGFLMRSDTQPNLLNILGDFNFVFA